MSTSSDRSTEVDEKSSSTNSNPPDKPRGEDGTNDNPSSGTEEGAVNGAEEYGIVANQQMQFGDGGDLQPTERTVGTTLGQFDVEISNRIPDSRLDQPEASGIMRDDRPDARRQDGGEQSNLFADTAQDQQTLDGSSAQNQCLYGQEN